MNDLRKRIYDATLGKLKESLSDQRGFVRQDPKTGQRSLNITGAPARTLRSGYRSVNNAFDVVDRTPLVSAFSKPIRGYARNTAKFMTEPAGPEIPKYFLKSMGHGISGVATVAGAAKLAGQPLLQAGKQLLTGSAIGGALGSVLSPKGQRLEGAKKGATAYLNMAPTLALTNPAINAFSSKVSRAFGGGGATANIAGRVAAGAGNVIEGFELNRQLGRPMAAGAAMDFGAGFVAGNTSAPNMKPTKAQFRMNPKDVDELIKAQDVLSNPNRYYPEGTSSPEQADRIVANLIKESETTIRRLAQRHLPAKSLGKTDDPISLATELYKLNEKNKLGHFEVSEPVMGFVGNRKATSEPAEALTKGGQTPTQTKYAFNINKPRLGLKGDQAKQLDKVVKGMRPIMEKNKGRTLSHKEIIEGGRKAAMLDNVAGREETKRFAESLQASRNFLKSQSKSKGISKKFIDQLEVVSSQASDIGRKLNAFATSAEDMTIKEKVLKDLISINADMKKVIAAGKNVNWDNAEEVTRFYREFKPATIMDRLDEFRYTNMLSSPSTHIVNTFSNLLQTAVVAPVEKTVRGGLDFTRSKITGREQKYFARQGVDYASGYWKSLPDAYDAFKKTFSGESSLRKPDVDFIPTSTSKAQKIYTTPLRLLESADQFFRTLTIGGETAALKTEGITGAQASKMAEEAADYRTFRQAFDPEGKLGQGGMLKLWDKWNSAVSNLRNAPGGKWIVPFLQTPTNILKQGVEYSPLGVLTAPGSRDPIGQLSKAIIGSTVFAGAAALAHNGLTTWDAPTNANERAEFYAAGIQPYSVKIGDKWVSYSKLGPLSYPMAMASALKWAQDNGGEDEELIKTAAEAVGGTLGFFADQSYVRGIGDIIDAMRGDDFKQGRALANIPAQLVPYRSAMGWISRMVDPVYRKTSGGSIPDQIGKSILSQVPFVSKTLPAYETPFGEESQRHFPVVNAFSPLSITQEQPEGMEYYQEKKKDRDENRLLDKKIKEIEAGTPVKGGSNIESKRKIAKKKLEVGMELSDEELNLAYGIDAFTGKTPVTATAKALQEDKKYTKALEIYRNEEIDDITKSKLLDSIGIDSNELNYYDVASSENYIKSIHVREGISTIPDNDRQALLQKLAEMRRTVNGKYILAEGVIDDLVDEGKISKDEGKVLKNIDFNRNGKLKVKVSGRGKGAKLKQVKFVPLAIDSAPMIKNVKFEGLQTPSPLGQNRLRVPRLQAQNVGPAQQPKFQVKFNL